jgi:alanine racemase
MDTETDFYSTWLEIDLDAIKNNIQRIQELTQTAVMAVVKANGYGHGLVEVARTAQAAGAIWCGVSRIEEAKTLRQAGITCRIMVLGYTPPKRVPEAVAENISLTVYTPELATAYALEAEHYGFRLHVHAKFDTGMGRLGFFPDEGVAFAKWLHEHPGLELEGIFTHFAKADEPDSDETDKQIDRFEILIQELAAAGIRPPWIHACNSAGAINYPRARYDMVRAGIAIYGLNPSEQSPLPEGFLPALALKARLISIKDYPAGHGISYGHIYHTKKQERIGVVPIGYADGFRRHPGNYALIHGKKVPILGKVCMDQSMLALDDVPEARIGDEVILIGSQNGNQITMDDLAADWGTCNYEVVTNLATRVPRIYPGSKEAQGNENE